MGDDFVAPVKVLLKALDTGIKLSLHILESASSVSTTKALQISESAPTVKKSLERTSQAIRDAYTQTSDACGGPFSQALVEDKSVANRLKELKNDVRDTIDECSDFQDDPDSFDPVAFANIQTESQRCYAVCISLFNGIRAQILEARTSSPVGSPRDDRATLTSMRAQGQAPARKPVPPVVNISHTKPTPLQNERASTESSAMEPVKPKSTWAIHGPSQFDVGPVLPIRQPSRDISPSSLPQKQPPDDQPRHIAKEVVRYRISANEDFLERRRQSKVLFQNELRKQSAPRSMSIGSLERPSTADRRISGTIEENRVSEVFDDGPLRRSPRLDSSAMAVSPGDGRTSAASSNSYDQMVSRQRSLGQHSQEARHSRTSSFPQEGTVQRQDLQRQDSVASQDSIFGLRAATQSPPLSPSLNSGPSRPANLNVENLATTLRTPHFGRDVPDGMEVADGKYDFSSEKIFVTTSNQPSDQNHVQQTTPTASMKSIDCPMRHDTSFYQYRGFCEGAATLIRGRMGEDWYKIVKKPLGNYSSTISAKCHKCSYEVGFNDLQKDKILDLTGIYMNSTIRWRQRFMTKSHLRAPAVNAGVYACVFCVEEHKTIEDHDATVFFSIQQLFRHLAKHPQPLPRVAGINVIYGVQPLTVLDFDLHFTTPIARVAEFGMAEIHQKVATRPSGQASATHHPKPTSSDARDPDGSPVLHFAVGARIVGITFPERFKGEWCSGYHDGEKGSFPTNTIFLEQPPTEDCLMNPKSTLVATAKWEFKPKDAKAARWLRLSKGEKIVCIGYTFYDSWCWSGQNSKGKWGIFPRAFVESPIDGTKLSLATSPTSRSTGFGLSSFSLGRRSSKQDRHERSMSMLSTSSGSNIGVIMESQPGLEVASSPSQQMRTIGSWKS